MMHSDRPCAEAAQLLNRHLIELDDQKLDGAQAGSLFSANTCVEFTMSWNWVIERLLTYGHKWLAGFARSQNLSSPAVIDSFGENQVRLRANLISTHVYLDAELFVNGTFANGEAHRCQDGQWRVSAFSLRVTWMTETPLEKP